MEKVLFVISAVCCVHFFIIMIGAILGNRVHSPLPILGHWEFGYGNIYVSSPSLAYQFYFWAEFFGIFL